MRRVSSWFVILCIAAIVLTGSWHGVASRDFRNLRLVSSNNMIDFMEATQTDRPETPTANYTFSNQTNITILDNAAATPYPSNIIVSGVPSTVETLTVTLNGLSHTFPSDLDFLLVGPSGQKFVLMSDAGSSLDLVNVNLTIDDQAAAIMPQTQISSGSYRPTNYDTTTDAFPGPAPSAPYDNPATAGTATLTSVFAGTTPNGVWNLFVRDDAGQDAGSINGGWSITIKNSITAQNTQAIPIPDSGPSSVYPSSINVSGLIGSVASTAVILNNFSHTGPDDVDLLLVAPGGRSVVLMSDVGGFTPATNLNLIFEDAAAKFLPPDGPLVAGNFKPTNIEAGDPFPAPAPAGPPTGDTLSSFNGINPNGQWGLFLVDDNGNNAGSIAGGWAIALSTSATACSLNLSSALQVIPITGGSGSFDINTPFGCDWTAVSISSWVSITSASSGSGGLATLTFDVEPNMMGGRTGIIQVQNSSQTRNFNIQQGSGCPFTLNETTQQFASPGGQGNVNVTAAGACGWFAETSNNWITINSGPGSGDGSVTYTVSPNMTSNTRTGTIEIGARILTVNQARQLSGARAFDYDGDGKSDVSVFRLSNSTWHISQSSNGVPIAAQFGLATDRLAPADYDGDNKVDIAVFRNGNWYLLRSSDGLFVAEQWGATGDLPVPADYDGDNKADLAVFRSGTWYVRRSIDGQLFANQFGQNGDRPLPGDYDNDGKADVTVYRPGASAALPSYWYSLRTSDGGFVNEQFGTGEDVPVPADYDGDGATNFAVFRPSSGTWFTTPLQSVQWGTTGDAPVAADYDGDGKSDVAVFRQGVWYILLSSNGTMRAQSWGTIGDVPTPSVFLTN